MRSAGKSPCDSQIRPAPENESSGLLPNSVMFASKGAFTSLAKIANSSGVLQCFGKNRVRACFEIAPRTFHGAIEIFHCSRIRPCNDHEIVVAARGHRRFDSPRHLVNIDQRFTGKMSAALRKFLIFNVTAGQAWLFPVREWCARHSPRRQIRCPHRRSPGLSPHSRHTRPAGRLPSASADRCPGTPAVAFAIPAPLMYTASNPARSTCRAIAAFGTPGIVTAPCRDKFTQSRGSCFALVMSSERSRHSGRRLTSIELGRSRNRLSIIRLCHHVAPASAHPRFSLHPASRQDRQSSSRVFAQCRLHKRKEFLFDF